MEEFDDEMREAIKNDLLNLAQELCNSGQYEDVELLIRAIRYIRKLEEKENGA